MREGNEEYMKGVKGVCEKNKRREGKGEECAKVVEEV